MPGRKPILACQLVEVVAVKGFADRFIPRIPAQAFGLRDIQLIPSIPLSQPYKTVRAYKLRDRTVLAADVLQLQVMQQNGATYEPKQAEQPPQKAPRKNDYER